MLQSLLWRPPKKAPNFGKPGDAAIRDQAPGRLHRGRVEREDRQTGTACRPPVDTVQIGSMFTLLAIRPEHFLHVLEATDLVKQVVTVPHLLACQAR